MKRRRPSPDQAAVIERHGLKSYLYVVLHDWQKSMIIQSIVDKRDVRLLQKER